MMTVMVTILIDDDGCCCYYSFSVQWIVVLSTLCFILKYSTLCSKQLTVVIGITGFQKLIFQLRVYAASFAHCRFSV